MTIANFLGEVTKYAVYGVGVAAAVVVITRDVVRSIHTTDNEAAKAKMPPPTPENELATLYEC